MNPTNFAVKTTVVCLAAGSATMTMTAGTIPTRRAAVCPLSPRPLPEQYSTPPTWPPLPGLGVWSPFPTLPAHPTPCHVFKFVPFHLISCFSPFSHCPLGGAEVGVSDVSTPPTRSPMPGAPRPCAVPQPITLFWPLVLVSVLLPLLNPTMSVPRAGSYPPSLLCLTPGVSVGTPCCWTGMRTASCSHGVVEHLSHAIHGQGAQEREHSLTRALDAPKGHVPVSTSRGLSFPILPQHLDPALRVNSPVPMAAASRDAGSVMGTTTVRMDLMRCVGA